MSGKSTIKNFADMLGTAKLPEKVVQVCLRGDLAADFEELERQIEEAEAAREGVDSLDSGAEVAELAEKAEALREQMKEHTYPFRLRALPRRAYRALVAAHPPRKETDAEGNEKVRDEDGLGFNIETFFEPLLRRAIVDPDLSDTTWDRLQETLTERQFEVLATAAWLLNRQDVDIPFSRTALKLTRSSAPE